ncbi:hypothetical protein EOL96_00175 [Candidatus Saccharibacteria bacterium]|nr:hypothetical protein [Candidatus Saccharibacteria bacterium]
MYSGTTFRSKSGNVIGVHQKIDRIARRNLRTMPGVGAGFPTAKDILHFEGNNGPDGIKRKSPSQDEPWHYIDPTKPDDRQLIIMILDHYDNLVVALQGHNQQRAAFEAAWLSHAIVDGLTPAHHYPLSEKIEELWGKPKEERITIKDKNIIKGKNSRDTLSKNWEYWGAKGVFLTHGLFEFGVATSIKTTRFLDTTPTADWIAAADKIPFEQVYVGAVQRVYKLDMYHSFWKDGWTTKLAQQSRRDLLPEIIRIVTYAWYKAYRDAGL